MIMSNTLTQITDASSICRGLLGPILEFGRVLVEALKSENVKSLRKEILIRCGEASLYLCVWRTDALSGYTLVRRPWILMKSSSLL